MEEGRAYRRYCDREWLAGWEWLAGFGEWQIGWDMNLVGVWVVIQFKGDQSQGIPGPGDGWRKKKFIVCSEISSEPEQTDDNLSTICFQLD